jgi:pyruvate,orthophosphate dikinase
MTTVPSANTTEPVYVVGTTSIHEVSPEMVGAKAFGLMQMSEAGLSVPPAFVLGTATCRGFQQANGHLGEDVVGDVVSGLREIEKSTGLHFGAGRRPLLLSVRSGAAVSMPGMLETILNVGLSDTTLPGLLRATGDPVFVWDSYRRLVQAYAEVVDGCPASPFAAVLNRAMAQLEVPSASELDVAALRAVVQEQQEVYHSIVGRRFPQDPMEQLLGAIAAVFRSWNCVRAEEYRALQHLTDLSGTSVTVQAMVFGNKGVTSGSGVGFTRDPATGANRVYVDFLLNAQGEDVVAGRHVVADTEATITALPGLTHELQSVRRKLEGLFRDAQDFEFTVEEGKLWMLQSRAAKPTAWAALHIACDLVNEGLIDTATAVERLGAYDLDSISRVRLVDAHRAEVVGNGIPASGGVASGRIALSIEAARRYSADGEPVVLVRDEASTDDIAGLAICRGVLTATGARTSHAAVVARQLDVTSVVGCRDLSFDLVRRRIRIGRVEIVEGEQITLDGATGAIYRGEPELCVEHPEELIKQVRNWQASLGH